MLRNKNWLRWLLVVAWMGLIFFFSAQQGADSGAMSGSIVAAILKIWHYVLPFIQINKDVVHLLIRKGAHFSVYLVLGILVAHALAGHDIPNKKRWGFTILICMLYAASDEIHQAFVPNRGPSVWDVLLDTSGSAFGTFLCASLKKIAYNTRISC